jgi:hypothetical protein
MKSELIFEQQFSLENLNLRSLVDMKEVLLRFIHQKLSCMDFCDGFTIYAIIIFMDMKNNLNSILKVYWTR